MQKYTHSSKGEGVNLVINKVNFLKNLQKKYTFKGGGGTTTKGVPICQVISLDYE
jgi:hypothetical protein